MRETLCRTSSPLPIVEWLLVLQESLQAPPHCRPHPQFVSREFLRCPEPPRPHAARKGQTTLRAMGLWYQSIYVPIGLRPLILWRLEGISPQHRTRTTGARQRTLPPLCLSSTPHGHLAFVQNRLIPSIRMHNARVPTKS